MRRDESIGAGGAWIAVSTHCHKERVAITNLERQGFHTYCPMIHRRIRHARRLTQALRPLFPGYVFIRLDPERDQWRSVLSTIGVRTLIRFGDRFGVVPREFVEMLKARERDGAVPLPRFREEYAPGELVRFRDGPFSGAVARVLNASESDRLVLLMDMLRQSVRVEASIDDVVSA